MKDMLQCKKSVILSGLESFGQRPGADAQCSPKAGCRDETDFWSVLQLLGAGVFPRRTYWRHGAPKSYPRFRFRILSGQYGDGADRRRSGADGNIGGWRLYGARGRNLDLTWSGGRRKQPNRIPSARHAHAWPVISHRMMITGIGTPKSQRQPDRIAVSLFSFLHNAP
jgi:hypothetical protein